MSMHDPPPPRPVIGKGDVDKHSQYAGLAARASLGIKHDTMEGRAERRGRRRPRAEVGGGKHASGRGMFSADDASVDVGFLGVDTLSRLLPSKRRVFKDHGPRLSKKMVRDALNADLPVGIQHGSQALSYTGSPVKPARLSSHGPILEALTYNLAREKSEAHAALVRVSELDRKLKAARMLDEQLRAAPEDLELGLTGLVGNDITLGDADAFGDGDEAGPEDSLASSSEEAVQLSDGTVGVCPPAALRPAPDPKKKKKKRRNRHVDVAEVQRAGAALGIGKELSLKLEEAIEKAVHEFHWGGLPQDVAQGELGTFGPAALWALLRAARGKTLVAPEAVDEDEEWYDGDDCDAICASLRVRAKDLTAHEIESIRAGARRRRVMEAVAEGRNYAAAHEAKKKAAITGSDGAAAGDATTTGDAAAAAAAAKEEEEEACADDAQVPLVLTTRLTKEALGRALGGALRLQQAARLLGPAATGAFASHFSAHWAHGEDPLKEFDLASLASSKTTAQRPHSHDSARGLPPVDEPSVEVSRRHMENMVPSPSRRSGRSGASRQRRAQSTKSGRLLGTASSSDDSGPRTGKMMPGTDTSMRDLRGAYQDSQVRLEGIRGQLRGEVERLTLAMPPGAMSGGAVGSFAQQWACDRMKSVMRRMVHAQLSLAFETIVLFAAYRLNLEVVESFRLVRGARRMGRPFLWLLERHFRASFYIWQRFTEQSAGAEITAAAVELCRLGRGFIVRRRIFHGERRDAALDIQRCQRGHRGRIKMHKWRRYMLEKTAVLLIERNWHVLIMVRNARKMVRAKRRENAAIKIQGMVRVAIALKSMRRMIREKHIADNARRIQIFCRGAMTRYRVGMLRGAHQTVRSVEAIQRIGRGYVTRKRTGGTLARHKAAKVLQRLWRARVKRKLANMKEEQNAAASVQAIYRGRIGRKKATKRIAWKKSKDNDQVKSAQVIQGKIRQREARKVVATKKAEKKKVEDNGAIALQNVYRGKMARAKVAEKKIEKKKEIVEKQKAKASTAIQSRARVKVAKKVVAEKKKQLWAFTTIALRLQSRYRAGKAMQKVARLKEKQHGAIGEIKSSYWKMHALYMMRQAEMHDKEVRIIQNMIRVQMSKIRLRYMRAALAEAAERKRRNEAARVIQGMKRKVAARATIALLREALKERKKMEALALQVRREQAASTIQGAYRGGAAKAQVAHMKYIRDRLKAVKLLIRCIRGRAGRKKYAMLRMLREQELQAARDKEIAAMRIQAIQRGIAARMALRDRILDEAKSSERAAKKAQYDAVVIIQCCVRKKLSRRRARERKVIKRKEDEERLLQDELEKELADLHRKQEQMLLVIRIQCCARKRLARNKVKRTREARAAEAEDKAMQVRHRAAAVIQSYVKGQNTRIWYMNNKLKIRQKQQQHRRLMYLRQKADAELQSIDTRITYLQEIGPHNHILRNLKNAEEAEWQADQWAAEQEQKVAMQLQNSQWATAEESAEGYADDGYGGYDANGYDANGKDAGGGAEWEQYYDESAQAYYWYNNGTGEASWTDPYAS